MKVPLTFADLQEEMQELQSIQPELVPATVTPEEWVNSNVDVKTSAALIDEDIIQDYQRTHNGDTTSVKDSDDDFKVHNELQLPPSIKGRYGCDRAVFPLSGKH